MNRRVTQIPSDTIRIRRPLWLSGSWFPHATRNKHSTLRAGFTLVEMVAILGVTATLMSLAAVTFQKSIRIHQLAVKTLLAQQQIDAMRWRLKNDLASATIVTHDGNSKFAIAVAGVTSSGPNTRLNEQNHDLESTPSSIVYQFERNLVTRTVFSEYQEVQSKLTWQLPIESVEIAIQNNESISLATLRFHAVEDDEVQLAREFLWEFRLPRMEP